MANITRTYSFKSSDSGLSPTSPRSLKDLQQQQLHHKAAKMAESVQQQGRQLDSFIRSLDEKPADSNHDFPGHVSVSGLEYEGLSLEGGTVQASHHPRELKGTTATLTKKRALWFDKKTDFKMDGDGGVTRVLNPGSKNEVTQRVSEQGDFTLLTVSGKPGSHELLGKEEGDDFELPSRSTESKNLHFKLSEPRHFDEAEPWHNADTTRITDPQKAIDRQAARTANQAIDAVVGVYEQAMALDQTDQDLNDRPGEVLLKDAQLGDRIVSGSVRPMYTRDGSTADSPTAGSYFQDDLKPYVEMRSENTGETFRATLGEVRRFEGDYGDNHADEIFYHSTPEQTVKARVGEYRTWYEGKEPGWYPHMEDDTAYPMGRDNLGGSVFISK